jgi:hypothetical protein
VGAYYDFYGQANIQLPQVCVVRDFPVAEGGAVPPATSFTKTWRVKNPGMYVRICDANFMYKINDVCGKAYKLLKKNTVHVHVHVRTFMYM